MGKRYEWIALALASLMGGPAFAQQTYGDDPPGPQRPAAEKKPQGDGVRLSALDARQVTALQQALRDAGYYSAEIDGVVGPKTKRALQQFYTDQAQLAAQGMILPRGAEALGLDDAAIERVRGEDAEQGEDAPPLPGAEDDEPTDMTRPPPPSRPTPAPGPPSPGPPANPHGHGTTPYQR
jgi:peptidoglycan hydrolase-like protein with peptidoglycan-binding domain